MNLKVFGEKSPGRIVPISEGDYAFIPHKLPPDWVFPGWLWPLLADAKQQVGVLEGVGRTLPNPAILLRPFADREAIRSSRLEGTYVTSKEFLLFELQEKTGTDEKTNDQREVFNYRRALNHGTTTSLPLSLRLLRELHGILMAGVRGKDRSPGEFRRLQVAIGPSKRFIPPPPDQLPASLDQLERYFHQDNSPFDPLVDCFLIHYQFETIHPFQDGNGRVGRLLLSIMLQQRCGFSKPWLYLSEFFERHRDEYIQLLFDVSTKANWDAWIEFCLKGTREQAMETIRRCDILRRMRDEYMTRLASAGGHIRLTQIVEELFHSPFVQVKDLPARLGITYPTAQADMERLVAAGIVQPLPEVSPKTYYAVEIFNVAYDSEGI